MLGNDIKFARLRCPNAKMGLVFADQFCANGVATLCSRHREEHGAPGSLNNRAARAVECAVLSASATVRLLSAEDSGRYSVKCLKRGPAYFFHTQGTRMTIAGLITFAKSVQNAAHEWKRAENRNF